MLFKVMNKQTQPLSQLFMALPISHRGIPFSDLSTAQLLATMVVLVGAQIFFQTTFGFLAIFPLMCLGNYSLLPMYRPHMPHSPALHEKVLSTTLQGLSGCMVSSPYSVYQLGSRIYFQLHCLNSLSLALLEVHQKLPYYTNFDFYLPPAFSPFPTNLLCLHTPALPPC